MEVKALDETALEEAFKQDYHGLIGFRQLINYSWMVDYTAKKLHLWSSFRKKEHPIAGQIKVRYLNHLPLVKAMIGDHEFNFLLDTGCSGLVIDNNRRDDLDEMVEWGEDDNLQGAGGLKVAVSSGTLKSYTVAEREFRDTSIKLTTFSSLQDRIGHFDGIIGYPMLSKARTVVSWQQKRLFFLEDQ